MVSAVNGSQIQIEKAPTGQALNIPGADGYG